MELSAQEWERAKELFQAALDLPAAVRMDFLNQSCDQPALRSAVLELLHAHLEAGSFLAGIPHPVQPLADSPVPSQTFVPSCLLSERFRVLRLISRGGMGAVYEAEDTELGARVALKTIRDEVITHPEMLQRFKREVALAKQVTHPNVCRIFDLFRHHAPSENSASVVFVSMELLEGETLSERLERTGRFTCEAALPIVLQIAAGLQAVHSAGILHRDLKPGNIMMVPSSGDGLRAVLTDFGLAGTTSHNPSSPLTLSAPFAFGTPAYMSPEQLRGHQLTQASDIYALGLVLYQMVTGLRPFDAPTPLAAGLKRLSESPVPPRKLVPEVEPRWEAVILKCLELDPDRRYRSVSELELALRGEENPSPSTYLARFKSFVRSLAPVSAGSKLAVVASLVVALGLPAYFFLHRPSEVFKEHDTIVLADFANTTGESVYNDSLRQALKDKLEQSPFLHLMSDSKISQGLRYMGLSSKDRLSLDVARKVCQRERGRAVLSGAILSDGGDYLLELRVTSCQTGSLLAGVSQRVVALKGESVLLALDQAADSIRRKLGESPGSLEKFGVPIDDATSPSLEALVEYTKGDQAKNELGGAAALPFYQRAVKLDPNFAMAYAFMGTIYGNMGENQKASESLKRSFELRDRVSEWEKFYISSHYYAFVTGEIDKEKETYLRWEEIYPRNMAAPINLGIDYAFTGEYEKAAVEEQKAIRGTPEVPVSYACLAQDYLAMEKPDDAQATLNLAASRHVDDLQLRTDAYQLAFFRGDPRAMDREVHKAKGQSGVEDALLSLQSDSEYYFGSMRSAQDLASQATSSALRAGFSETAAAWNARSALWEAHFGNRDRAIRTSEKALALAPGRDVQVLAALALAKVGKREQAKNVFKTLKQRYPLDTLMNNYWLPVIQAQFHLSEGRPSSALESLSRTSPYEFGTLTPVQCSVSVYLRGQAYLNMGQGKLAEFEFQRLLAHRGVVLNCPLASLAQLGLARALALNRDAASARIAYQNLLARWKDADPDLIPLGQASHEYRLLAPSALPIH